MAFLCLINGGDPNHVSKSWDNPPSCRAAFPESRRSAAPSREEDFPPNQSFTPGVHGCFQKIGLPQNWWFIMETPIYQNGWLGGKTYHYFRKHPYLTGDVLNFWGKFQGLTKKLLAPGETLFKLFNKLEFHLPSTKTNPYPHLGKAGSDHRLKIVPFLIWDRWSFQEDSPYNGFL